jgi:transcriptional regulator with XRE-family HTH domain
LRLREQSPATYPEAVDTTREWQGFAMNDSTDRVSIGLAVRRARRARGLTLAQAAGLVGHAESWLSRIEHGHIPLDKRADIAALAEVLEVSADMLLGEPAPEVQPGRGAWNLVPLRAVLLDASPGDPPDIPARTVPLLRDLNGQADAALRWSRYDELLPVLPVLIGELEVQVATAGGLEREEALRLLVPATETAVITLRYAEQPDLAWVAAERGRQAAALLGDPVWEAAAAYSMAHARSSANKPRALMVMPQAADRFESLAGQSRMAREVYGMLRLSAALACAVAGDHAGAEDHGAEAERVAGPLGDEPDAWELFGVSNTGVWRTSLAVEAGNAEKALEYASRVEPRALASKNRRAALRMEKGRAYAMQGDPAKAVREIRQAEALSPAQVLNNPLLRELVRNMLDEARRKAAGRDLRGLAWRMGLI